MWNAFTKVLQPMEIAGLVKFRVGGKPGDAKWAAASPHRRRKPMQLESSAQERQIVTWPLNVKISKCFFFYMVLIHLTHLNVCGQDWVGRWWADWLISCNEFCNQ